MEDAFLTLSECLTLAGHLASPGVNKDGWCTTSYASCRLREDGCEVVTKKGRWFIPKDAKFADNETDLASILMTHPENETSLHPILSCDSNGEPRYHDRSYFFKGENDDQFGAIRIQQDCDGHEFAVLYHSDETQEYGYTKHRITLPELIIFTRCPNEIPRLLDTLWPFGKIVVNSCFYRSANGRLEIARDPYGTLWYPFESH